jgi:hypothetical protein
VSETCKPDPHEPTDMEHQFASMVQPFVDENHRYLKLT